MATTTKGQEGECGTCNGSGVYYEHHEPGMSEPLACDDCFGTGFLPHRFRNAEELGPCDRCGLPGDDDIHTKAAQ